MMLTANKSVAWQGCEGANTKLEYLGDSLLLALMSQVLTDHISNNART